MPFPGRTKAGAEGLFRRTPVNIERAGAVISTVPARFGIFRAVCSGAGSLRYAEKVSGKTVAVYVYSYTDYFRRCCFGLRRLLRVFAGFTILDSGGVGPVEGNSRRTYPVRQSTDSGKIYNLAAVYRRGIRQPTVS